MALIPVEYDLALETFSDHVFVDRDVLGRAIRARRHCNRQIRSR